MVKKHIQSLSGFQPVCYSCCINSCVCFIRAYEDLNKCPNCKEAQLKVNGKPRKYFDYIPIIPQLQAMLANSLHAKKMCYRANHVHEPGTIKDIFGGSHYQTLLNTIVPTSEANPFFYFSDGCDIALGLLTDGFAPFKKCDKMCWPIILSTTISLQKYISKRNIAFMLPQSWCCTCCDIKWNMQQLNASMGFLESISFRCILYVFYRICRFTFKLW